MTGGELEAYLEKLAREYAAEQVAAGSWLADGAVERARADSAGMLPQGVDTPGHLLRVAEDASGARIGVLWLSLEHPRGVPQTAFINDIEVDEDRRGQGLGRALLDAAEREVRRHGVPAVGLNVFASNTAALRLYASAGYAVVTQQMVKRLT